MAQGGDGCAPRTIGDRIEPHVDLVARITGFFARIREGHDGSAAETNVPACAVPLNTANPAFRSARLDDEVETAARSEEHTSELQSLMRISYAVFCLKKKKTL